MFTKANIEAMFALARNPFNVMLKCYVVVAIAIAGRNAEVFDLDFKYGNSSRGYCKAIRNMSNTSANPNRWFYGCAKRGNDPPFHEAGCKFFKWVD